MQNVYICITDYTPLSFESWGVFMTEVNHALKSIECLDTK